MTRDHASLQRRAFLTPIWLTVLGAAFAFVLLGFAVWVWGTADSTTVVIVRHAEKQPGGDDPPLTPAGEARAVRLMGLFGDAGASGRLDAIYVSPTTRSRMTAAPLAARLGLVPIVAPGSAPRDLARRVLREHAGGRVLIIGHSDTINEIVAALGGTNRLPPIADQDYGTVYVVSVPRIGRVNVLRESY